MSVAYLLLLVIIGLMIGTIILTGMLWYGWNPGLGWQCPSCKKWSDRTDGVCEDCGEDY
jgi:hypothetical protein